MPRSVNCGPSIGTGISICGIVGFSSNAASIVQIPCTTRRRVLSSSARNWNTSCRSAASSGRSSTDAGTRWSCSPGNGCMSPINSLNSFNTVRLGRVSSFRYRVTTAGDNSR